jgi:sugar lactone lactonase YvrE
MVMEPSEDFTIGSDGMLYGVSTGNDALIRSDYDGAFEILAPNVSTWGRGTRFLPGGDLVVVVPDTGTVQRFDPATWGSVAIATGLSEPNGLAIGDDGMVYLTQLNGLVLRIDPDTLEVREIEPAGDSTDGITFGPDYRTLYWNHEAGEVIRAVLDDDGYVIDGPYLHADLTDFGSGRLDGMTSDACGNLYVVRMAGQIVRVFPNGSAEIFADLSATGNPFICAVNFGSGSGGFVETNLYVMDLTGGMFEIETDIPPNPEPHL